MAGPARLTLAGRNDRPLVLCLALTLALACAAGTQYVAWRFRFDAHLGAPMFALTAAQRLLARALAVALSGTGIALLLLPAAGPVGCLTILLAAATALAATGPVFPPWDIIRWQSAHGHSLRALPILRMGWTVVATAAISATALLTWGWRRRKDDVASESHGSAHWGTGETLRHPAGPLLGTLDGLPLRYAGEGHILTVAPTRSGKGVGSVIPNLLDHEGSVLVTDPKGENYAVTAQWRCKALGQTIHAFDPFDLVGGTATFNPLELIDPSSSDAVDDARLIADMLVLHAERHDGEQSFWNEEARGVLTGLVLHVAANAPPELRTLTTVRALLTLPPDQFEILLAIMADSTAANGLVARAAARLLQKAEKERSGVISTAQSHTHFLDSPRMARVLDKSTVRLDTLKSKPASVYLVLPGDRLDGYARWLRLMTACALLSIQRARGQPRHRVLFLLDEFAHLGRMQPVVRDIGIAGGYGLSFWLVIQDLSQLKSTYGEIWPTFLANADVLQAFGTNDWDTAEYLSKMTGETTIRVASENESRGVSRGRQTQSQRSAAVTVAEKGRRLLLPDEVRRLPRDAQLLFAKGTAPVLATRINYLRDTPYAQRAGANPLYASLAAGS